MQTHQFGRINEKFSSGHPATTDELTEQGYNKETTYEAVKGILAMKVRNQMGIKKICYVDG